MEIEQIRRLFKIINKTISKGEKLPSNCFFINKYDVLAMPNELGDARHPYTSDGMTLWAYSSGYISINESNFYIIPQTLEGKESYLNLFLGIKNKKGYDYLSLLGVNDTLFGINYPKYVIFSPSYVTYLRKCDGLYVATRLSINNKKEILINISLLNSSKKDKDIYLSSYINPLLTHTNFENEETKWFRNVSLRNNGALVTSIEDLSRTIHLNNELVILSKTLDECHRTSSRMYYVGNKNGSINSAPSLVNGYFNKEKEVSQFIDSACYGDINKKLLKPNEKVEISYLLKLVNEEDKDIYLNRSIDNNEANQEFLSLEQEFKKKEKKTPLNINFSGLQNVNITDTTFNSFLKQVTLQVDYCSRAKNSSLMLLGIRDIAQMLEASVMYDPKLVKEKIKLIFNFIDPSGRTPRQISIPKDNNNPLMDNREFIDQGQWLISLVYRYICYTNDLSILNEKCYFYKLEGRNSAVKVNERTTILDHLKRVVHYLISHIDDKTHCLSTLYGDWNDAVDGLGASEDKDKEFGNGVSVMASFHLYQNLFEYISILKMVNEDTSLYEKVRKELSIGIKENAFVSKDGINKIVHGWGNDKSFYVGSFDDVDHISRDSATSNAFYALSGYYKEYPEYKDDVLKAFSRLDSKYGIKTFNVPFDKKDAYKVGRIVNLPKGTAENAATYIHAAMFSAKALFTLKEGNKGYEQLMKLIPITHDKVSVSPYIMPNSYGYNLDLGIDGESMNDWYTGSSNTLLKTIVDSLIGVNPLINNHIEFNPVKIPVDSINMEITIKGRRLLIHYLNKDKPYIKINNELLDGNILDLDEYLDKTINIEIGI